MAPDETAQLVTVVFNGPDGRRVAAATRCRRCATRPPVLLQGSGLQAGLTGTVAIGYDATESFRSTETIVTIATIAPHPRAPGSDLP